jgi:hypothetical protein
LPPDAGGIVMPGVHDAAPVTVLQLAPMLPPEPVPPEGEQFVPLQQRLGCGAVCGAHVRLGAQPPVESQRQPWLPTIHVEGTPAPELALLPEPDSPELPPEPLPLPELAPLPEPDAPEAPPEPLLLPELAPLPEPDAPELPPEPLPLP